VSAVGLRHRGTNILETICSQMAVRLSAILDFPLERFLLLTSVKGSVDPRVIMQLE
jgi:hypothetical protein